MSTLEEDLARERRRIEDVRDRAKRRLSECRRESEALAHSEARPGSSASDAPPGNERRDHKLHVRAKRYEDLVQELVTGGDRLAVEALLARLMGPEVDELAGEVERTRELTIQRATDLLVARDRHRALRHRWTELVEKIRSLRQSRGLPEARIAPVDFRLTVAPGSYVHQPEGPTYREVSDLLHHLGA